MLARGSKIMKHPWLAAISLSALCLAQQGWAADPDDAATRPQRPAAFVFAHDQSDILPDPAARFGRLKNGMTYVLYKNKTPPGSADLFLRFGVGSMMEQDYQRGLAHFLEHMAFNGSSNVPQGDMVKMLERDGLSFGGDTNASTSYDQTLYTLNVTKATDKTIDDCIFLMRELSSNLSLDPGAIDRQRGVVLSEERLRSSAEVRAEESFLKILFPSEKMPQRQPIGLVDIIQNAPASAISDYYRDFYRPEYATFVIVGDIDVDRVEAKIKAGFADWAPAPQSKNAVMDYGALHQVGPSAYTYSEKGLRDRISIVWTKGSDDKVQTRQTVYEDTLRETALGILAERYHRQANEDAAAFLTAGLGRQRLKHTATINELDITPKPGKDAEAIDQATTTLRQFFKFGVSNEEIDQIKLDYDARYAEALKAATTRMSGAIAGQIMGELGEGDVITSPAQDYALYMEIKPRLTLNAVNDYIKRYELGYGPLIYRQAEDVGDLDKTGLMATYAAAVAKPLVEPAPYHVKTWPYRDFGPPGAVVSRAAIADFGAVRVTFANGVALNFKSSRLSKNDIAVRVRFGGGMLTVRPGDAVLLQAARTVGLTAGGLGKLSAEDLGPALAGKLLGSSASIDEDETNISGETTPDSFATQMQLLMAFATEPAFRPIAWEKAKANLPDSYKSRLVEPGGVFAMKARPFLRDGDPRFGVAPLADVLHVKNEDIAALWRRMLSEGPVEVDIVGDVAEDQAVKEVAATFGTLAPRPATVTAAPGADVVRFPTRNLHQIYTDEGRTDKNISFLAWPTTDLYASMQDASGLDLLSAVMTSRLLAEVRERQGATYAVFANNSPSTVFKGYGVLAVNSTVKPEVDPIFYASVLKIVNDLKTKPVSADELQRARQPEVDKIEIEKQYNDFYLNALFGSVASPQKLEAAKTRKARLMQVGVKDIQGLANTYLEVDKVAHIQVKASSAPDPAVR